MLCNLVDENMAYGHILKCDIKTIGYSSSMKMVSDVIDTSWNL